jgi:signal transduction histidine kinase
LLTLWPLRRLRHNPAARYLMLFLVAVAIRCFLSASRFISPNLTTKVLLGSVESVVALVAPVLALLMVLTFIQKFRFTGWRWQLFYFSIPAISALLIATNPYHHWVWTGFTLVPEYNMVNFERNWAFWIIAAHLNLTIIAIFAAIVYGITTLKGIYRRQATMMLLAMLTPWLFSTAVLAGWLPPGVNITPITFGVTALLLAWTFRHYHLFDLIPIAHDLLFDEVPDGVLVLDQGGPDCRIVDINPAGVEILRLPSRAAVIGQEMRHVLPAPVEAADDFAGHVYDSPRMFIKGIGYLDVNTKDIFLNGKNMGRVLIFRDVTAHKHMEDELRRAKDAAEAASRAKSAFLSNVSHELRSPLGLIELAADTLHSGHVTLDHDAREWSQDVIHSEVTRLAHMVDNLLEMSRLENQRFTLTPTPVDLVALLAQICHKVSPAALAATTAGHNIKFKTNLTTLPAQVDAPRLEQVLINLLQNAVKYSPEGGDITVRLLRQSDTALIEVQDQGLGIPPEEQPHLFERFYRGRDLSMRHIGGTGLGLSISHEIVTAHQGNIWVQSAPGQGSTFFVSLPLNETAEPAGHPQTNGRAA